MSKLANKTALITGASSGIGHTTAHQLADVGCNLVLSARSEDKLNDLKQNLSKKYPNLKFTVIPCDVSDSSAVEALISGAIKEHGQIDILINNAGVAPKIGLLQEISLEDIDRTIDINLKGAIYTMRAVIPEMINNGGGTIININSIAGKTAFPYWSIYDASKFGLTAITNAVADEQASNNIKVVGIHPGAVNTNIWDSIDLGDEPDFDGMLDPEQIAETILYVLNQPEKALVKEITITPLNPVL